VDIHHIRYFLSVCETLNFTRAAEQCNVTQPALSRAIQQLESEVGGLLFRRERNLTHLTDLGLLLKPRFEQIVSELGQTRRELQRFLTMEQASVNLGVMCTIGPLRFSGMLAHLDARHPGISLAVTEGTPPVLSQRLEEFEIDLAIMASPDGFPGQFAIRPLYRERFVVAFPAGHRLARLRQVPLKELHGEDYLERLSCEYSNHIDGQMRSRNCLVKTVYQSEREDWIQNLVAGGMGIATLPEFSATVPGIQTRPIVEPPIAREICLVSLNRTDQPPACLALAEAVQAFSWGAGTEDTDEAA
jgi:DNA-binding transcriptional LysR family regulator